MSKERTPVRIERIRGHLVCTSLLHDDATILDLGAHKGAFSKILSARIRGKFILAEANPELYAVLPSEEPFTRLNCAVTDEDKEVFLNLAENPEASTILKLSSEMKVSGKESNQIVIAGLSLRSLFDRLSLPIVDLIKLDIEGAECAALDSLSDETLSSVPQITVEFHDDPVFHFDLSLQTSRVIGRLCSLGFLVLRGEFPSNMDVLFLNRRFVFLTRNREAWLRLKHEWLPYAHARIESYRLRLFGRLSRFGRHA
ncbi:MAG TPA: hypothetical protein DIT76_01200 [Spartobacteria bacterium]|nr:hypothetical protein [Spartobacteria bacterium]HCP90656.1 hypothetical protein [Spartobacteria bacterium]